jgi:hypothetical protein
MIFSIPTLCSFSTEAIKVIAAANACPTSQTSFDCDCFMTKCFGHTPNYNDNKCE